jgi:hypothetical protein
VLWKVIKLRRWDVQVFVVCSCKIYALLLLLWAAFLQSSLSIERAIRMGSNRQAVDEREG